MGKVKYLKYVYCMCLSFIIAPIVSLIRFILEPQGMMEVCGNSLTFGQRVFRMYVLLCVTFRKPQSCRMTARHFTDWSIPARFFLEVKRELVFS